MTTDSRPLSIGQCAALATLLECTAPKPGNVHRGADFEDVGYPQFVAAGIAIAPMLDQAVGQPLGQTVLAAVEATRALVGSNTNLGTILLLAPLAAVARHEPLVDGVRHVLRALSPDDARDVYRAICLAAPGAMGTEPEMDVHAPPPDDLVAAMRLAAPRDLVARQYAEDFEQLLTQVVPWLAEALAARFTLNDAIVRVQLRLLSTWPDSLIARKCGAAVAEKAAAWARRALAAGQPGDEAYEYELGELDFWMRSDGHRRNPGTTADLLAAGLFVCLRDGIIKTPLAGG